MSGVICGAIVVDDKGRIAMVKEAKRWARGKWNWPAGKLEQGEGIIDAARREVREETGLEVKVQGLIGIYRNTEDNVMFFVFLARPVRGEIRHRKGELLDARWFTVKELMKMKDSEFRSDVLRRVMGDWKSGKLYPVSMIKRF